MIDEDVEPLLIKMNLVAMKYGITVIVNSSYRSDSNVKGAIVTPAKKSNHMVGHAIDCNLRLNGILYNSTKMQSDTGTIRKFINEVKETGMRWGGDFNAHDPIHFDDGLNIKNMPLWIKKFQELHK
jgi:hypothetical protein